MTLAQWPLVVAGLAVVAVLARLWHRRDPARRPLAEGLPAANTDRLRESPRYRALAAAALRRSLVALVSTALVAAGSLLLVGRLADTTQTDNTQHNRDIMLCLDVSGSMHEVDSAMLRAFARVVDRMRGERVGLTIWNNTAVMVFPLTDDYAFVADQLERTAAALDKNDFGFIAGTSAGTGASLIGDGLASCVQRFDRLDEPRSRAVVLATDNDLNGTPIHTLAQAVDLAVERRVAVHGIADSETQDVRDLRTELRRAQGEMYLLGSGDGSAIVAAIEATQARRLDGMGGARVADIPLPGLALGTLGLVGLALGGGGLPRPGRRRTR